MTTPMIGLEVHVQLNTDSKLFCDCPTNYLSVDPNTNLCPTCTAQPGSKPYGLNRKAMENVVKIALALNCEIVPKVVIQRKHYFYPDLPTGFQRTSKPVGINGKLGKIRIREVHIEEDPGRYELREGTVDYNRAGVPLIEIVTEPDFDSPEEARAFLDELAAILDYLDSRRDEPGSTRVDANISIDGGVRAEVKNINSFKGVYTALKYEIVRQANVVRRGGTVVMETRHFEEATGTTSSMRLKESEADYRYIPDPDVPPAVISNEMIEEIKSKLPELPRAKSARFVSEYNIREDNAWIIVAEPEMANMFEKLAKVHDANKLSLWIRGPLKKQLNYRNLTLKKSGLKEEWISSVVSMFLEGKVTDRGMETLLIALLDKKEDPEKLAKDLDLLKIQDQSIIDKEIVTVLAANEKAINDYKRGEEKSLNFLVGQVIKATKGKADSQLVKKLIIEKIGK